MVEPKVAPEAPVKRPRGRPCKTQPEPPEPPQVPVQQEKRRRKPRAVEEDEFPAEDEYPDPHHMPDPVHFLAQM